MAKQKKEIVFRSDNLGRCAMFKDTLNERFRSCGRGNTDAERIEDLYKNIGERKSG